MLCKREEKDARKCLKEGRELTSCGLEFYRKLKRTCRPEMEAYAECIDKNNGMHPLNICLKNRAYFDDCMKDKFGLERPELGYFSQVRVHKTTRPEPKYEPKVYEILPGLPDDWRESVMKNQPPADRKIYFR